MDTEYRFTTVAITATEIAYNSLISSVYENMEELTPAQERDVKLRIIKIASQFDGKHLYATESLEDAKEHVAKVYALRRAIEHGYVAERREHFHSVY